MSSRPVLSSPSASPSTVTSNSSGSSSTRDSILQKYGRTGAKESKDGTETSNATASGKSQMECFESADVTDTTTNASSRNDRSLLSGSVGGAGKKPLSSGIGGAHGGGSEDVEISSTRPLVAFQSFAGALYRGTGPTQGTFESGSDIVGPASGADGAANGRSGLQTRFESPFVRLQRLQHELSEFSSDLAAASKEQRSASQGDEAWTALSTSVAGIQGQLDGLLAQPQVQHLLGQSGGDGSNASAGVLAASSGSALLPQFDSLFSQYVAALQVDPSFKPAPEIASASPAPATGAAAAELAALPKLDERLAVVEKFIGLSGGAAPTKGPTILSFNPGQATSTTPATPSVSVLPAPDLITSLASLHAQLAALNPQRLEFLQRAVKGVLLEQESLALASKGVDGAKGLDEKKDASASASGSTNDASAASSLPPYAAQVSHLYSLTSRWDALAVGLPSVIARLQSLHTLHASSATLLARVQQLETSSNAIDQALRSQTEGIASVQKAASENLKQIQSNFHAMEKRMAEISAKMSQIKGK